MILKIGTRGSKLALWQAYFVQDLLLKSGIESQIEIIETKGDKILEVTLSKIGSKGVFTEELEQKLISSEIDIAVHSAKDLPSHLPNELEIIAFTKREIANDVIVSFDSNFILKNDSSITIGSSSTRRVAFLRKYYSNIKIIDMRGNLQTRFQKLKSGDCDAMLLAFAGVHRLNLEEYIVAHLPLNQFIPPVGQGSVAIECAKNLDFNLKKLIKNALNDLETEQCLLAERSFLAEMNGGCSIPTFAYAQFLNQKIEINGGIISLDGTQKVELNQIGSDAIQVGKELATKVLRAGGDAILKEIKRY
ncbi:MAG: hydroxymethylbilane synthase [Cytophagales bacterium]|nr:MAG: hydroxymethylbilane synthase [Cytophagales bacterium]